MIDGGYILFGLFILNSNYQMFTRKYVELVIITIFFVSLLPFIPFKVDDAYISYVYAKNLVIGNGLTYNGIPVEGYSNPIWTLLLAPFIALGADPLVIARVLSILSGVVLLLLMLQLTKDLTRESDMGRSLVATASVAVLSPILAWTMGGLETIFFSVLIVFLVYTECRKLPINKWFSPLLLLLIALTRPEGLIVFLIWLIYRIRVENRHYDQIFTQAISFIFLFLIFIMWRYTTYGYLLPNTAYLKIAPSIEKSYDAGSYLLSFFGLRPVFTILVILGITVFLQRPELHQVLAFPTAIIVGFVGFVVIAGGDWMPHHRFIAPILPLMALFIMNALNAFDRKILRWSMLVVAIIGIGFEIAMVYSLYKPLSNEFGRYTEGLIQAGKRIKKSTDESTIIAVVDAGAIAYYGERKTIDILGLNNEYIAHSPDKIDIEYVLDHKPQLIQLHVGFSDEGQIRTSRVGGHNQMFLYHPNFLEMLFSRPKQTIRPILSIYVPKNM